MSMDNIDMTESRPREFQLASVVGTFDPGQLERNIVLGDREIEDIERELNETIRVSRGVSERGASSILAIQRHQSDFVISDARFEVRSSQTGFTLGVAEHMAELWNSVISRAGTVPWTMMGYNFIVRVESTEQAVEKLKDSFFQDDLADTLGHDVLGGTASIWLEMEGNSTLFMKLEPYRNSRTTNRIVVNANFDVPLTSAEDFPSREVMAQRFWDYWGQLDSTLRSIVL